MQKMINLRQGKGTRAFDQIPLRAMGPAYVNEYEARTRSDAAASWIAMNSWEKPSTCLHHPKNDTKCS